jgi:pimeloyl-ACP methyl ester carboxylesterase
LKVHFVHERARLGKEGEGDGGRKVVPLLMVHGWPGTWFEFQNVMGPLLKGEGKGKGEGEGEESGKGPVFDLVVPSLPGYCWSQGPPRGHTLLDTARLFDTLMKRLGVCVPSSFLAYIR